MDPRDRALRRALLDEETGELLTLPQLAARAGLSLPLLETLAREGLLLPHVPGPEPRYRSDDAEAVAAGLDLVGAGLPLAELLEVARRADEAMRPVADMAVDTFVRFVSDPVENASADEEEATERMVQAFETMLPAAGRLVAHHFRRLLVDAARRRL
jgi:hypothetical protein